MTEKALEKEEEIKLRRNHLIMEMEKKQKKEKKEEKKEKKEKKKKKKKKEKKEKKEKKKKEMKEKKEKKEEGLMRAGPTLPKLRINLCILRAGP